MADTESMTILDMLREPAESPSDAGLDEESLPRDEPLDDGQSPEDGQEVSDPTPDTEEPESTEDAEDGQPEEESSPEPPAETPPAEETKQSVNWDTPDNPYFVREQQLKQFVAEQREKQEAEEQDKRFTGAIKGLIEVDENDVDALAGDLIEEIRESAVSPYQAKINELAHGFTAFLAAYHELPPEQQKFVKERAESYGKLGNTAEEIEKALEVRKATLTTASAREAELAKQIRVLAGENKRLKERGTNADRTANTQPKGPVTPPAEGEEDMYSYLRGTDEEGRSLQAPYGVFARTG
jgi:hypothetical protein